MGIPHGHTGTTVLVTASLPALASALIGVLFAIGPDAATIHGRQIGTATRLPAGGGRGGGGPLPCRSTWRYCAWFCRFQVGQRGRNAATNPWSRAPASPRPAIVVSCIPANSTPRITTGLTGVTAMARDGLLPGAVRWIHTIPGFSGLRRGSSCRHGRARPPLLTGRRLQTATRRCSHGHALHRPPPSSARALRFSVDVPAPDRTWPTRGSRSSTASAHGHPDASFHSPSRNGGAWLAGAWQDISVYAFLQQQ